MAEVYPEGETLKASTGALACPYTLVQPNNIRIKARQEGANSKGNKEQQSTKANLKAGLQSKSNKT